MLLEDKFKRFDFDCFQSTVGFDPSNVVRRFVAHCVDMEDDCIVQTCIAAAKQEGVDSLFLLDKKFVVDALREKIERDHPDKKTPGLKPCPFCGCHLEWIETKNGDNWEHPHNDCFLAHADSTFGSVFFSAGYEMEQWNRRAKIGNEKES